MKSKLIILIAVFVLQNMGAQNYQTVEGVDEVCNKILGFSTNEDAEIAVERILNQIGIMKRIFELRSCPNINNAAAVNIKDENGDMQKYILYDLEFMDRISGSTGTDWAAISILAHEIGHHILDHSLNNKGSKPTWELEADYWSGWAMAKLGATLEESQSAINSLRYEKATSTHPAKADRLIEIEKGWIKALGNKPIILLEGDLFFGDIEIKQFKTKTLTISNNGTSDLKIFKIINPKGFFSSYSGIIKPGNSVKINVTFTPTKKQLYNESIIIVSNANNKNNNLKCYGKGIDNNTLIGSLKIVNNTKYLRYFNIKKQSNLKYDVKTQITIPPGKSRFYYNLNEGVYLFKASNSTFYIQDHYYSSGQINITTDNSSEIVISN